MTLRLVSPDRKLFLVGTEDDLKAVGDLYNLTPKQRGNIRQLLGWTGVGNCRGDRNDRTVRYESENFMISRPAVDRLVRAVDGRLARALLHSQSSSSRLDQGRRRRPGSAMRDRVCIRGCASHGR